MTTTLNMQYHLIWKCKNDRKILKANYGKKMNIKHYNVLALDKLIFVMNANLQKFTKISTFATYEVWEVKVSLYSGCDNDATYIIADHR